jgi:hypothetical protein
VRGAGLGFVRNARRVRARPVLRRWRDRARGRAESLSERPLVELTESAEVLTFARPVEATTPRARLDAFRLRGEHAVAVALRIFVSGRRASVRTNGAQRRRRTRLTSGTRPHG